MKKPTRRPAPRPAKLKLLPYDPVKAERRKRLPHTWGELKALVEAGGVTDADPVFEIDLGPYAEKVVVRRDGLGVTVEDDPWAVLEYLQEEVP